MSISFTEQDWINKACDWLKSGSKIVGPIAFEWKDAIFLSFIIPPDSAEALVRWGRKINYFVIAYFLCNIFAKNCQNQFMYVRVMTRLSSDIVGHSVFFRSTFPLKSISINFVYLLTARWLCK